MSLAEQAASLEADAVEVDAWTQERLDATFSALRAADRRDGPPSLALRRDRLDRLSFALVSRMDDLAAAANADFGHRPLPITLMGDIASSVGEIVGIRRSLRSWMRPRHPQPGYLRLAGIRAQVVPQPLGVVGVIAPWNAPIALAIHPVAAALAAGNRVMLKTSEIVPRTSQVLAEVLAAHFDEDELAVVVGDVGVAQAFSRLEFDHILFTGAPTVGREVAKAAAANLVPVTLELGGKNPTVVGVGADLARAAKRIARARLANSGQICLSPDYVFVHRSQEQAFLREIAAAFRAAAPTIATNPDYGSIVNGRHYARITALIDDARAKGAHVEEVVDSSEPRHDAQSRRLPPTVVSGLTDDMTIVGEEVFGPVLSVLPYDDIHHVIDYVNEHPTPLAAYWFGDDSPDFRLFVERTRSGGVTRNDFAIHAVAEGLPFGGVGNSGNGYYHGRYGFDTFSHLRTIAVSPKLFSPTSVLSPPFSPQLTANLQGVFGWYARRLDRRIEHFQAKRSRPTT